MIAPLPTGAFLRLLTWLSPAFPVGGFSYSHGLEYAVAIGDVGDRKTLTAWVEGVLRFGAGLTDAVLLRASYRAAAACDWDGLLAVAARAEAMRPTAELHLESTAQGRAFVNAVRAAWPDPRLDEVSALLAARAVMPAYPVAVGLAAAVAAVGEEATVIAYLQGFAASLISAGVRLIPLGQTDGIKALADLWPAIEDVHAESAGLPLERIGSAAWMADWASARHETLGTRLFRS